MTSIEYYTPRHIMDKLGEFDLDPCTPVNRLWDTAKHHFNINDDGLKQDWFGRVWLNPPYGRGMFETWMHKMAVHGNGIALIPARTGTKGFHKEVFSVADSILFLEGRISFIQPDGTPLKGNDHDSCLIAYSPADTRVLFQSGLKGNLITNWNHI